MRVAKMPYLQRVDGIYRVRIVVPDDLKPHLPPPHTGTASLTKALGTGNKAEANRLSVPWIAEFQAAITKAAEIRRNPVLHDWIGRYACYHPGENPFAPEQRIITQNPALILPGTHTKPVTYESIIDKWMDKTKNGKKKGKKAREDMERAVKRFTEWLKLKNLPHDDMSQVTFENCRDYRDHLYTSDPNPDHFKTHSNQLKMLRALFSCAAKDRHLSANPFADLEWDRGKENPRPDFTPEERGRILRLARSAEDPVIKWGNWLAALGGYQNEELADAHARDVYRKNGIWVLHIREDNRTPDQRLKTPSRTRIMPLHSAILEEGFLKFVESVGDRPLFHHLKLDSYGRRTSEFTSMINEWLHETVCTKKTFYSHRHTVTSILRNTLGPDGRPAVDGDIQRYLLGHSKKDVHSGYGENWVKTLKAAIEVIANPLDDDKTSTADVFPEAAE